MAEECFPRGRPAPSADLKVKKTAKAKPHVRDDLLFSERSQRSSDEKGKEAAEKRKSDAAAPRILKEHGVKDVDSVLDEWASMKVDFLHPKKMQEGMLLLGCVREIRELKLVVSLPHGNTGVVQATNVSAVYRSQIQRHLDDPEATFPLVPLQDMFRTGQLLVCSVLGVKKRVAQLTLEPSIVNKYLTQATFYIGQIVVGAVKSKEDHGFTVDVGKSGVNAFIPSDEASGIEPLPGAVVRCVVTNIRGEGSILLLSLDEKKMSRALLKSDQSASLDLFQPGMVGSFDLKKKFNSGAVGKFLGFSASMSVLDGDMDTIKPGDDDDDFSKKRKRRKGKADQSDAVENDPSAVKKKRRADGSVRACILYVNTLNKQVCISTKSLLLREDARQQLFDEQIQSFPHGKKCRVTVDQHIKGLGALMHVDGNDHIYMFCPLRQFCDEKVPDLHEKYSKGNTFNARVIQHISISGAVIVCLKKSIVESEYFDCSDLTAGSTVQCCIKSVTDKGLYVALGSTAFSPVRGFVPKLHLADVTLQHPEKMFSEGDVITCKVLSVNKLSQRLSLTHKKTLLKSKLPTITSYDQLTPGTVVHAYIASIKSGGIHVNFYENVHGYIPNSQLSNEFVEHPEQVYYVGQVMKCRVLSCDAAAEKVRLSFILNPSTEAKISENSDTFKTFRVKVESKDENGVSVSVMEEGKAVGRPGFIPTMHLSDYPSIAKTWHQLLVPGNVLDNCIIITRKRPLQLTRKRSMVEPDTEDSDAGRIASFSDLKEGLCLPGFVRHVTEYGVFVQLQGGLVGLCPKSKMADRFLSTTDHYYQVGQSVLASIVEIDHEKKRFIASLRVSDSTSKDQQCVVQACLDELKEVMKIAEISWLDAFSVGSKIAVELTGEVDENGGYVCTNSDFGDGFSASVVDMPPETEKNGCMTATLLSIDFGTKQIKLSGEASLLGTGKKPRKTLKATVKNVNEDLTTVVAADGNYSFVALMPTRSHPNHPIFEDSWSWKVGEKLDVTNVGKSAGALIVSPKSDNLSDFVKQQRNNSGRKRQESESSVSSLPGEVSFGNLEVNQEVEGVIRSVRKNCLLVRFTECEMEGGYRGNPVTGRLHISEMMENAPAGPFSLRKFRPWEKLKCRVAGFRDVRTQQFLAITKRNATRCVLELSLRSPHNIATIEDLAVGQHVVAFSSKLSGKKQELEVEIAPSVKGFIPLSLLSDEPQKSCKLARKAKAPVAWHCIVTKIFKGSVSLAGKGAMIDRESQEDVMELKENCITNGRILKIFTTNMVLGLPNGCSGRVHVTDSSDEYVDKPFEKYQVGEYLRCAVVFRPSNSSLVLSLRPSRLLPTESKPEIRDVEILDVTQLTAGQILRGYVKDATKLGIFVAFSRDVTGRVEMSKATKYFIHDLDIVKTVLTEGKVVVCKVLNISQMEGKISLSMLESDTGHPDFVPEKLALPLRHGKEKGQKRKAVGTLVDKVGATKKPKLTGKKERKNKREKITEEKTAEDRDSGLDEDLHDEADLDDSAMTVQHHASDEDPGFSWEAPPSSNKDQKTKISGSAESDTDDDEEEEEDVEVPKKKTKMEKAIELAKEEAELRRKEELAASDSMPQTAHDWDKLVLASPQNSMYWVSYMVFHLRSTEVDSARAVAERAIKTIDLQEEKEKWNVWAALLNLENKFGSDDSLQDVMERARQHNDPLKVNTHMVSVFEKCGKFDEAQQLCEKMLRKFRRNKSVWILYITHLMQQGKRDEANNVMKRSLQSMEKSAHLDIISKFAQLEYKFGDPEQGRVVFENALSNYPKRADIWSIYIDMLVKTNRLEEAREVFERVVTLNMSAKKMRTFFKRFVEFETKYGTDDSVAEVKQKALEFVESKTNQLME